MLCSNSNNSRPHWLKRKMAKGMKVNRPKNTLYNNLKKLRRIKKQQKKKQGKGKVKTSTAVDPLTTDEILKKRRTNPKANITLSSKKRRLILKTLKRGETRNNQMEVTVSKEQKQPESKSETNKTKLQSMDID